MCIYIHMHMSAYTTNVLMDIYIYIHTYTFIHVYIHVYVYVYVYVHVHTCKYTCIHVHVYIYNACWLTYCLLLHVNTYAWFFRLARHMRRGVCRSNSPAVLRPPNLPSPSYRAVLPKGRPSRYKPVGFDSHYSYIRKAPADMKPELTFSPNISPWNVL